MAELDSAREDARGIIDTAHAENAALLQETGAALDAELGEMRRNAARAREEERAAIEKASAAEVEQIRKQSAGRTDTVRKDIIARILPGAV